MRGGLLVDCLVGLAIESMGYEGLTGFISRLDSGERRDLILKLNDIERNRESFEAILAAERVWQQHAIPLSERIMLSVSGMGRKLAQPAIDAADLAYKRGQARLRLLGLELAIRNYHQANGSYPDRLTELVPTYLPILFDDPFTGRPFVYQERNAEYLLYSVGPDKQDDGGRAMTDTSNWKSATGDISIPANAD